MHCTNVLVIPSFPKSQAMAQSVKASCFHAEVRGSNPGGGKDIFSKIFLNLELDKFDCESGYRDSLQ